MSLLGSFRKRDCYTDDTRDCPGGSLLYYDLKFVTENGRSSNEFSEAVLMCRKLLIDRIACICYTEFTYLRKAQTGRSFISFYESMYER